MIKVKRKPGAPILTRMVVAGKAYEFPPDENVFEVENEYIGAELLSFKIDGEHLFVLYVPPIKEAKEAKEAKESTEIKT